MLTAAHALLMTERLILLSQGYHFCIHRTDKTSLTEYILH